MTRTHQTHIPRDASAVARCESFVRELARESGVSKPVMLRLQLVLEEIVTDFIKYNREGIRDIAITVDVENSHLRLRAQDFGVHDYDITQHPSPDLSVPIAERPEGGLGIHLVRSLTDEFEYHHADGVTSILTTLSLEPPRA